MYEKRFSVRAIKAMMEDCYIEGVEDISESDLLELLEIRPKIRPTPAASDSALPSNPQESGDNTPSA